MELPEFAWKTRPKWTRQPWAWRRCRQQIVAGVTARTNLWLRPFPWRRRWQPRPLPRPSSTAPSSPRIAGLIPAPCRRKYWHNRISASPAGGHQSSSITERINKWASFMHQQAAHLSLLPMNTKSLADEKKNSYPQKTVKFNNNSRFISLK